MAIGFSFDFLVDRGKYLKQRASIPQLYGGKTNLLTCAVG